MNSIEFREVDKYLNIYPIFQSGNKNYEDWYSRDSTKLFLDDLIAVLNNKEVMLEIDNLTYELKTEHKETLNKHIYYKIVESELIDIQINPINNTTKIWVNPSIGKNMIHFIYSNSIADKDIANNLYKEINNYKNITKSIVKTDKDIYYENIIKQLNNVHLVEKLQ